MLKLMSDCESCNAVGMYYCSDPVNCGNVEYKEMTPAEELALALDGREYPLQMSETHTQFAKDNNLVVVYGLSDDLVMFNGAWCEEAYGPGDVFVNENGPIEDPDCDCKYATKYYSDQKSKAARIRVRHGETAYWEYETEVPHATFKIIEDDQINCIALVINADDLTN